MKSFSYEHQFIHPRFLFFLGREEGREVEVVVVSFFSVHYYPLSSSGWTLADSKKIFGESGRTTFQEALFKCYFLETFTAKCHFQFLKAPTDIYITY